MSSWYLPGSVTVAAVMALGQVARPEIIYVADEQGDVLQYDTRTDTVSMLGSLNGFPVVLAQGLAFDPSRNSILILDRGSKENIYGMNALTGEASLSVTLSNKRALQGGAVKNGLLYGVDEARQIVAAYDLATGQDQGLSANTFPHHTHSMGVDPVSGQLYSITGGGLGNVTVRPVGDDGTIGSPLVTATAAIFYRDMDFFNGDFVATQPNAGIHVIDHVTGNRTTLVSRADLLAVPGFDGGVGIVVGPGRGLGDFDFDGDLDGHDIDALVASIAGDMQHPGFDMNGDATIDRADLSDWLAVAGALYLASGNPYLPGDANLDGFVDGTDFNLWNSHKFTATAAWTKGDFLADGLTDGSDFNVWNSHKFTSANDIRARACAKWSWHTEEFTRADTPGRTVPEASSSGLFIILGTLVSAARRKNGKRTARLQYSGRVYKSG